MASDDELDRLWRDGLVELAPPGLEPDDARVEERRAHLRRRRVLTLGGAGALALGVIVGVAAVAAAGDPPRRVRTVVRAPSPSPTPATTAAPRAVTTIPASTTAPEVATTVPASDSIPPDSVPESTLPPASLPATSLPPPVPSLTAVPTTLPAGTTVVTLTLDDAGLHAAPPTAPAGMVDFTFVDGRSHPGGSVEVRLEIQPRLAGRVVVGVGASPLLLLCPHNWFLTTRLDGGPPESISFGVDGVSPECTTPIT